MHGYDLNTVAQSFYSSPRASSPACSSPLDSSADFDAVTPHETSAAVVAGRKRTLDHQARCRGTDGREHVAKIQKGSPLAATKRRYESVQLDRSRTRDLFEKDGGLADEQAASASKFPSTMADSDDSPDDGEFLRGDAIADVADSRVQSAFVEIEQVIQTNIDLLVRFCSRHSCFFFALMHVLPEPNHHSRHYCGISRLQPYRFFHHATRYIVAFPSVRLRTRCILCIIVCRLPFFCVSVVILSKPSFIVPTYASQLLYELGFIRYCSTFVWIRGATYSLLPVVSCS